MRVNIVTACLVALAACGPKSPQETASNQAAAPTAETGVKGIHREDKGRPAPDAPFADPDGKTVRIADFKGRPVLVNLWASWCAPCVKELPTLEQLSRSGRMQVLAVSQDTGPHASVVAFLKAHGISELKPYQDSNMRLSGAIGPDAVLPTSILFDASGREVWRYVGDLDWTGSEAARLLAEAGSAPRQG